MLVMVAAGLGIDFYAQMPATTNWMLGVGVIGLMTTIALHRWGMKHPRWAGRIERNMAGPSLLHTGVILDEIESFERE